MIDEMTLTLDGLSRYGFSPGIGAILLSIGNVRSTTRLNFSWAASWAAATGTAGFIEQVDITELPLVAGCDLDLVVRDLEIFYKRLLQRRRRNGFFVFELPLRLEQHYGAHIFFTDCALRLGDVFKLIAPANCVADHNLPILPSA